jgi:hypothetical protein
VQPSAEEIPRWWQWPTVLSLDAPVVAVLWQGLLARPASAAVGAAEAVVLGLSVWLAYSADRWIEGWRLEPGAIRTQRHHFYQRWRWPIAAAWAAVLAAAVTTSALGLSRAQLAAGLLLLVPVAAYLLSHQLVHRTSRWRAPKEVCVALLIAAGSAVFIIARPEARAGRLVVPLGLFSLLCFTNCALISLWESEVDRSHGQTSLALQLRRTEALRLLPWAAAALAAAFWLWVGRRAGPVPLCAAASGILLGAVDLAEASIGRRLARVLADVALMTPAAPMAWGLLR